MRKCKACEKLAKITGSAALPLPSFLPAFLTSFFLSFFLFYVRAFSTSVASQHQWLHSLVAWLEHRTGIARSRVQIPFKPWIFFFSSFTRNSPFPEKNRSCMEVRLNSPRGKFKITNMADDQVDITAEDIPGASFIEEEIEKLTVSQQKVWLKCLRLNQNGNEKELLAS